MLWFLVWTGLVLGWLVGAFFGLRWLWRQVKALIEAAEPLTEALERLDRTDAFTVQQPRPVDVWATPQEIHQVRTSLAKRRKAARARRRARHEATYAKWAKLAGYSA